MLVNDDVDSKGLVNDGDYEANFVPRSLITQQFLIANAVVNAGGTPSIQTGLFGARPAFGTSGRIYIANDTQQIFEDTGAAWELIGSGLITGVNTANGISGDGSLATPVILGGTLTGTTSIDPNGNIYNVFDDAAGNHSSLQYQPGSGIKINYNGVQGSNLLLEDGYSELRAALAGSLNRAIKFNAINMLVADDYGSKGLVT